MPLCYQTIKSSWNFKIKAKQKHQIQEKQDLIEIQIQKIECMIEETMLNEIHLKPKRCLVLRWSLLQDIPSLLIQKFPILKTKKTFQKLLMI